MAWKNHHPSSSISPTYTFGNAHETFEESDTENCNLGSIIQEVDYGDRDANVTVKKEVNLSGDEAQTPHGRDWSNSSGNTFSKETLSQDFGFIRSCLNIVLEVDSKKRHELVQAMKSKLKQIEVITTGKKTSNAMSVKLELLGSSSSMTKLSKVESNSRGQLYNSDECDHEEGSLKDTQQDGPTETVQEESGELSNSLPAMVGFVTEQPNHEKSRECDHEEGSVTDAQQDKPTESVREDSGELSDSSAVMVGLITDIGGGSVKCNVCERIITNLRRVCAACSSYVSRMRTKCRESGRPLPSCKHKNFSAGAWCQSCRLRKYIKLSRTEPIPPSRIRKSPLTPKKVYRSRTRRRRKRTTKAGEPQKCIICEKKTPWFKGWRCSACFMFHTRLITRYEAGEHLPECDHDGSYAGVGCKRCRLIRLQRETARRDPELASRLPDMPIGNAAHSAEVDRSNVSDDDNCDVSARGDVSDKDVHNDDCDVDSN